MKNSSKISFFNLVLTYITLLLGFFITITKAKVITPEEIGVLSIILVLSQTIGNAALFGVPAAIIRFYTEHSGSRRTKSAFITVSFLFPILLFLISCMVLVVTAAQITELYKNEYLTQYFDYLYLFLFATIVGRLFRVLFEVEQKPLLANVLYDTVVFTLHLVFLLLMLVVSIGFYYYFLFNILILFIRIVLFLIYLVKDIEISKPDFSFLGSKTGEYLKYCFFMFFSSMAGTLTTSIDKLMLGYYVDLTAVGIYTIITALTAVIVLIGGAFSRITHPMVAGYWQKNETEKIEALYKENANIQLFFGLFVFIVFSVYSVAITGLLGEVYVEGAKALIILCAGQIVSIGTGICGGIISMSRHYRFDFYTRGFLVVLTIVTNIMLIPIWGLNGAAAATAVSLVLYNLAKVLFVYFKFKMQPYNLQSIKVFVLAFVIVPPIYYFQENYNMSGLLGIAISSSVFFLFYMFCALYLFRIKEVIELKDQILGK